MQTISVIIPAYNEEKRLPKTLAKWNKFLSHNKDFLINEIIIVDDGSVDKTINAAQQFNNSLPIKIIKVVPNQGKGNAVKTGVLSSDSDFIFAYDADAAVAPEQLNKIFPYSKNFDVIIGSRVAKGSNTKMSLLRKFIGKCFHALCQPLIPNIQDASCGAKLFKSDAAKRIFSEQKIKRFAFDIEILWLAKQQNLKIKEVGVKWQEVPESKVSILKDSFEMFFSVLGLYKRSLSNKK